jgi:multidrug resistance efflux pump
VKKYEQKQATIESLEDELRKVRVAIEQTEILDPAPDLRKVRAEIKTAGKEREELEDEVRKLEAQKKQAAADLEIYKGKYPLRSK